MDIIFIISILLFIITILIIFIPKINSFTNLTNKPNKKINKNTVLLYSFCNYIGRHKKKDLIKIMKLQIKFIHKHIPDYFIIYYTNFEIKEDFSKYNIEFRDYYDKSIYKLYDDKWLNLSFNRINIYKDLYDEYNKDFIWIDLDTLVVYDISYINKLDNIFIEQGGNDNNMRELFTNNKSIIVAENKYIQGDFWKLNINLYNDLMDTLKYILQKGLKLRYDVQDLVNFHVFKFKLCYINILGNNLYPDTINGLTIWNNDKIKHGNIDGLNNLYYENNKLKTKYYPDKYIHILSFTFFTLLKLYNKKQFKHLFLN